MEQYSKKESLIVEDGRPQIDLPTAPQRLPRTEIIALCERLGHDPGRVAEILIQPDRVTVSYHHPVSND